MKAKLVWASESLEEGEKEIELEGDRFKVEDILRRAGVNPVTVLVKLNDRIIPVEEEVEGEDIVLELIPVVSGG